MQKATFWRVKDGLLERKRPSFAKPHKNSRHAFYVKYHKKRQHDAPHNMQKH